MSESPSNTHRLQRLSTSSPQPRPSFLRRNQDRNSEEAHAQALDESKRHHDKIYDIAVLTLESHNYERLRQENEAAEARALASEKVAAEAEKARQLAERNAAANAKKIQEMRDKASADAIRAKQLKEQALAAAAAVEASRAAEAAKSELQRQSSANSAAATTNGETAPAASSSKLAQQPMKSPETSQAISSPATTTSKPTLYDTRPIPSQTETNNQSNSTLIKPQPPQSNSSAPPSTQKNAAPNLYLSPSVDRLRLIHQNLKKMRAYMKSLCDQDRNVKVKAGELRRLVRMSVGQLTGGETDQNANKQQLQRIINAFKEALANTVAPTPLMNVEDFVVDQREPAEGAANNGQLPVLYMFLVNHFSKAVMAQLALEGTKPLSALSVGIFTVRIFATPEFLWRGKSLIDVLIAKFRVACPVLFGVREDDTTAAGRTELGWKKTRDGDWIAQDVHASRVMGFAAGYSAICLRDFSKSKVMSHPYAIAHYWKAIAGIVATPGSELTKTQCYVLKALIDHYEKKFVGFYGSAAIAVLQVATIQVPNRVQPQNDATIALGALATKMHLDLGINLKHDAFRA